jgi:uncharacterized membrane protein YhhN
MLYIILSLSVVTSAFLTIRAREHGLRIKLYVFKPLTMILITITAVITAQPDFSQYFRSVVVGLIFCLAGDVLLMLPRDRFTAGLISFLMGHVFYISAFTSGIGFGTVSWLWLPFLLYGIVMTGILLPALGKLRIPVFIYMGMIVVMAWQAWERWYVIRQVSALLAGLGAVLFLVSDSALAIHRFRRRFKYAQRLILSSYFMAQWLIALSVRQ